MLKLMKELNKIKFQKNKILILQEKVLFQILFKKMMMLLMSGSDKFNKIIKSKLKQKSSKMLN